MEDETTGTLAARVGGWSLLVAAASFMAVFGYLAASFDYPAVLDGTADEVLPRLLELGATGRAVWTVYALVPLLLVPASVGAYAALHRSAPNAMRLALVQGVITAMSMLAGLARWPTIYWEMARAWPSASPAARATMSATFDGLNLYLGNFIGEFLGEIALNSFFAATAYALLRAGRRRLGGAGLLVAGIGFVAALRNVTPLVAPAAEVDNYVLPLWLIVLGGVLARR